VESGYIRAWFQSVEGTQRPHVVEDDSDRLNDSVERIIGQILRAGTIPFGTPRTGDIHAAPRPDRIRQGKAAFAFIEGFPANRLIGTQRIAPGADFGYRDIGFGRRAGIRPDRIRGSLERNRAISSPIA
jgi:hypothetical protein